jgi:hypothetical protein
MEKYFYKIDTDTELIIEAVKNHLPKAQWYWASYMTIASGFHIISKPVVEKDPFLKSLNDIFKAEVRIYKVPSKSWYRWHKDALFGVSMNMVLEDYECHTLFYGDAINEHLNNVIELKYQPKTWYLFNTQEVHGVLNLDSRDRILVSMNFPKEVSYEEVKQWYVNYKAQ